MKKGFVFIAVLIIILFQASMPIFASTEKISKITVTFGSDTKTTKAFTWYTSPNLPNSDVQISTNADFSSAANFGGVCGPSTNSPSELWHKATATGLNPDSLYYYRVGDKTFNVWSSTGTFSTANNGDFTFIALTDTQSSTQQEADVSASTMAAALKIAPNAKFMLHSGDVVDKGTSEALWNSLLSSASPTLLHTTIVPVAGNHESKNNAFIEHFNLTTPKGIPTQTGAYYSFDYGNTHFVNLNTNESSETLLNFTTAQIDWMKQDILNAKANGAKWIIVNTHKGFYTAGEYAMSQDIIGKMGNRTLVAPLLDELGANLVFQGHDHYPSITKPLYHDLPNDLGTVYINCNTAGVKVYPQNKRLTENALSKFSYLATKTPSRGRFQNFAVVAVTQKNIIVTLYEIDNNVGSTPYIVKSIQI